MKNSKKLTNLNSIVRLISSIPNNRAFRISLGGAFFLMSICSALILMTSCSRELEKEEYVKWVKDPKNGLHTVKESGGFVFDLQFQPEDYVWLQSGGQTERNVANQSDNIQHYLLTISLVNPELDLINNNMNDSSEKQEKLYYFSYLFQNDIQLDENGKLLPCVLFHFEKNQDLKGGRTFLLGFESSESKKREAKVVIQSEQFGSLPIRIKVNKENIPTLKI
jgi:hypothetical protein